MPAEVVQVWDAELSYTHTPLAETSTPVAPHVDGAEPLWCVYQFAPATGVEIHHALPHTLLEWRCALYGIDPDDITTLLDVALHEPYIPAPDDVLTRTADPSAVAVLQATHGLPTCWTPGVPDEERRAAYLARIAAVKQHRVRMEAAPQALRAEALAYVGSTRAAPPDPLEPITSLIRLDPVRVEARRMAVEWLRASRADKLPQPTFQLKPGGTFVGMQPPPGGAV
ncbi:hypothetical protein [Nonomuraea sp. SYSU D8015]|uniref:hypothetical protein n=1 Tax=Nonomuraea sp. SYSU D8015 TaxID=2593644 RepID=UPI001661574C|nr:hypothetical protein [Nonomuraea sp. SYSU D8015]